MRDAYSDQSLTSLDGGPQPPPRLLQTRLERRTGRGSMRFSIRLGTVGMAALILSAPPPQRQRWI